VLAPAGTKIDDGGVVGDPRDLRKLRRNSLDNAPLRAAAQAAARSGILVELDDSARSLHSPPLFRESAT
jgi:hypothetical protein